MAHAFYAFLLAVSGNMLIYSGLAFINGKLFAGVLEPVYSQTGIVSRTVIMTLLFAAAANYIFSIVYRLVDPAVAGMVILISLIIVLTGKSILLGVGYINLRVVLSVIVLAICASWVNYELHRIAGE